MRGANAQEVGALRENAMNMVNRAESLQSQAGALRQNRVQNLKDYGKEVAPAVATLGAGGAGAAYGLSDADTMQNQLANASNRYLGTDFGTQSRLGALLG